MDQRTQEQLIIMVEEISRLLRQRERRLGWPEVSESIPLDLLTLRVLKAGSQVRYVSHNGLSEPAHKQSDHIEAEPVAQLGRLLPLARG